jgi:hypothetical protein
MVFKQPFKLTDLIAFSALSTLLELLFFEYALNYAL